MWMVFISGAGLLAAAAGAAAGTVTPLWQVAPLVERPAFCGGWRLVRAGAPGWESAAGAGMDGSACLARIPAFQVLPPPPADPWTGRRAILPRLREIFVQEGVPGEWVWIAEVESGLNPRAVSRAGAAGLFQLMPATARRFGLSTGLRDERLAPAKSAAAAARYLRLLRAEFGCWPLALAAYNAGEGRVRRTLAACGADSFEAIAAHLPGETRAYVPKVMATVSLREDQLRGVPGSFWMPRGP